MVWTNLIIYNHRRSLATPEVSRCRPENNRLSGNPPPSGFSLKSVLFQSNFKLAQHIFVVVADLDFLTKC